MSPAEPQAGHAPDCRRPAQPRQPGLPRAITRVSVPKRALACLGVIFAIAGDHFRRHVHLGAAPRPRTGVVVVLTVAAAARDRTALKCGVQASQAVEGSVLSGCIMLSSLLTQSQSGVIRSAHPKSPIFSSGRSAATASGPPLRHSIRFSSLRSRLDTPCTGRRSAAWRTRDRNAVYFAALPAAWQYTQLTTTTQ